MTTKTEPLMDENDTSVFECVESNDLNLKSEALNESDMTPYKCNESDNVSSNILERIKFSTLFCLRHGDKKAIIDWCMKMGLITSAYFCAKCGKSMKLREKKGISDGYEWFCRTKGVNGHVSTRSVRTGSWFSRSRMNMCEILMLTHCWVYRVPHEWVFLELGCAKATVSDWFSYCRDICISISSITMIGGTNKTVEIEETQFDMRKYRGEYVEGIFVLGGMEKGSTKCFFKTIENRSSDSLLEVIKTNILPGTTVISHCWKSYNCLDEKSFVDLVVSDKYSFEEPEIGSAGTVGGMWRALKDFMPIYADLNNFDCYLAEYTWRKSNCYSYDKMKSFIEAVKVVFPLRTRDLPCE